MSWFGTGTEPPFPAFKYFRVAVIFGDLMCQFSLVKFGNAKDSKAYSEFFTAN